MVVAVTDLNDVPPMFTRTPRGNVIDVRNDAPVGEVVGTVTAADSDGTAPGNVVRYATTERGSSDRATKYFVVDEETGDITIADDLTKELYDEYRVSVPNHVTYHMVSVCRLVRELTFSATGTNLFSVGGQSL